MARIYSQRRLNKKKLALTNLYLFIHLFLKGTKNKIKIKNVV